MIIGGSSSQKLAANIAREMGDVLCPLESKKFPDGERYIRIKGDVEDGVVVVQSTGYPQDENLMELFLILKTIHKMGVKKIKTVIPYFGYGRQEKSFNSGEAISAEVVCQLIEQSGASEIYSINLHEASICNLFNVPAHNLSAMPTLANHIRNSVEDPVIVAPDKGALGFADEIANILGCGSDYLEKVRLSPDKVETKPKNLDVEGKDAVIIDDIISTGGTIVNSCGILQEHGARRILVSCVHPVLVEDALLKIFAAGADDVIGTDTLKSEVSSVSVAGLVADTLKKGL
ncbi:ribose-phosphate diphosphokinase [Methanobacterium petrolearium]|uniref:ribose-phosphate diphosphokinase n=1 Tax=Methanobacterium petrolearium TaxID=710190 RepID=UPI001AE6F781|nr:ribose-phosphate diphosphokinase [Methanobacterium petrolearium]MBP1946098.1 ribose-phosphate pyrophosphokinase [Methanobacterium petrolearium]BDZ70764.1 ribose-phosphate pyrophosphokinase [Methanobacterium petrolearium]